MDEPEEGGPSRSTTGRATLGVVALTILFVVAVRSYTHVVRDHYRPADLEAPRVDLNRAEFAELVELPGIGESLAQRILSERASAGPFRSGEELVARVEGIGEHRLALLLEYADVLPIDPEGP